MFFAARYELDQLQCPRVRGLISWACMEGYLAEFAELQCMTVEIAMPMLRSWW